MIFIPNIKIVINMIIFRGSVFYRSWFRIVDLGSSARLILSYLRYWLYTICSGS